MGKQMKLLLTMKSKKNLLLMVDTETEKIKPIEVPIKNKHNVLESSGIAYSGEWLAVGLVSRNGASNILISNLYSKETMVFECVTVKNVRTIVSVYPGRLYCNTDNGMSGINFDPINLSSFEDNMHFVLEDYSDVSSICTYKNKWFVALPNKKRIYDLTNDRILFSGMENPSSIVFNSNDRMCFLDSDSKYGRIVCGDDVFYVSGIPSGLVEDLNSGGYWTVVNVASAKNYLTFVDYSGTTRRKIDISGYGTKFNDIMEVRGRFGQ